MIVCTIGICMLGGCGGGKTKEEVNTLFGEIYAKYTTDSLLSVAVDTSKVVPAGEEVSSDKAYIFPVMYEKYLTVASGFVFDIARRQEGSLVVDANKFSNKQCEQIYNSLEVLKSSLSNLSKEIDIFEKSSGNLHYKELIEAYNVAVKSSFDITKTYSLYYFENNPQNFSSTENLSNNTIRNMVWWMLSAIGEVSFEYEILNQSYQLPYGEILTWFRDTQTVYDFCSLSSKAIRILKSSADIFAKISPEKVVQTQEYLNNLLQNKTKFDREYNLMKKACDQINIKEYLKLDTDEEKQSFAHSLSLSQQSCLRILNDFMDIRYTASYEGMDKVILNIDN